MHVRRQTVNPFPRVIARKRPTARSGSMPHGGGAPGSLHGGRGGLRGRGRLCRGLDSLGSFLGRVRLTKEVVLRMGVGRRDRLG